MIHEGLYVKRVFIVKTLIETNTLATDKKVIMIFLYFKNDTLIKVLK